MNVARLNFSHGSYEWHAERLRIVRSLSQARDRPIAILQDLSGPKIRIGEIPGGGVELKEGETLFFTTRPTDLIGASGVREINLPVPALLAALTPGQQLILGDGLVTLKTLEQRGEDWLCQVVDGGLLTSRKGVSGLGLILEHLRGAASGTWRTPASGSSMAWTGSPSRSSARRKTCGRSAI